MKRYATGALFGVLAFVAALYLLPAAAEAG